MQEFIRREIFREIVKLLGTPTGTRVSYKASSIDTALKYAIYLFGCKGDSENNGGDKLFLTKEVEDAWRCEVNKLALDKLVQIYDKSLMWCNEQQPVGESCIKTNIPVFLGEDGKWYSQDQNYSGEKSSIVLNGVKWFFDGKDSDQMHILLTHHEIGVRPTGKRVNKKFGDLVGLVQQHKVPYTVINSLSQEDYTKFVESWKV